MKEILVNGWWTRGDRDLTLWSHSARYCYVGWIHNYLCFLLGSIREVFTWNNSKTFLNGCARPDKPRSEGEFDYTHFCRIRDGGGGGAPLTYNLWRTKLTDQTIHHWKGNLSKSPIHFRYRQNIFDFATLWAIFAKWLRNGSRKNFQTFKIWTYCISF